MTETRDTQAFHEPVLVREVLEVLRVDELAHLKGSICFIDATVGLGGHAKEFVKRGIFTIGVDADAEELRVAEEVLSEACPSHLVSEVGCFKLLQGNFSKLDELTRNVAFGSVMGVFFDLGISMFQLDNGERGFSFKEKTALLDMRLDVQNQGVTAADLLAVLDKNKLTEVFLQTLPFKLAEILTKRIVARRNEEPIKTVGDFLEMIRGLGFERGKIHEATLPFLALRMAVNSELVNLVEALAKAFDLLSPKGRLAVISFHSGEDRVVKNFYKKVHASGAGKLVTLRPIEATENEVKKNIRSRSAKLRVIEKLEI